MYYIERNLDTKETFVNDKKLDVGETPHIEDAIVKVKFIGKKSTINKLNYDKLLTTFDKTYSIDFQFEYSDTIRKTTMKTMQVSDTELLDNYCTNNKVKDIVKKIATKILNG